jgi:hypothetical protein
MYQNQIDNPDLMVGEMSGNGAEAQVGHLYNPVKVVGRVRHGQEQYLQCPILPSPWSMKPGFRISSHVYRSAL